MQIRALLYYREVVRAGSLRKAAQRLGVAPTAITRQIENLEHQFGTQLIERDARGIRLTAAGELLAARTGRVLRDLDQVHMLIDDLKGLRRGSVKIVTNGALAAGLIGPVLAEFSLAYPKVMHEVSITSASAALEAVSQREADIAITLFSPPRADIQIRQSCELAHAAIMSPDHPLAGRREVTLEDLATHALALPDSAFAARQALEAAMHDAGLVVDPVFETASIEMQKELARRGAAILILPELAIEREKKAGELIAVPLAGPHNIATKIDLNCAREHPLSFAATKLVAMLEREMGDLSARAATLAAAASRRRRSA
jgi:DNA-binding transcriptional LysR family regulator